MTGFFSVSRFVGVCVCVYLFICLFVCLYVFLFVYGGMGFFGCILVCVGLCLFWCTCKRMYFLVDKAFFLQKDIFKI